MGSLQNFWRKVFSSLYLLEHSLMWSFQPQCAQCSVFTVLNVQRSFIQTQKIHTPFSARQSFLIEITFLVFDLASCVLTNRTYIVEELKVGSNTMQRDITFGIFESIWMVVQFIHMKRAWNEIYSGLVSDDEQCEHKRFEMHSCQSLVTTFSLRQSNIRATTIKASVTSFQ